MENQFVDPSVVSVKKPRRLVTFEEHMQKFDDLLNYVNDEIEKRAREQSSGARPLRKIRKRIIELQKETPKVARRKYCPKGKKRSGFILECEISDELRTFMKLEEGVNPSRKDITNAICVYIHLDKDEKRDRMLKWKHLNPKGKRDLQDPNNRMAVKPDSTLSKLLDYEKYKKKVQEGKVTRKKTDPKTKEKIVIVEEDPSLYYYVIQKLIQKHILEPIKKS